MCLKAVGKLLGLRPKAPKADPANDAIIAQLEEQRKQAKIMAQEAADERARLKEERLQQTVARKRKGIGRRSLIMSGSSGEGFLPAAVRRPTDG